MWEKKRVKVHRDSSETGEIGGQRKNRGKSGGKEGKKKERNE